jgi:hypothetical protein
MYVKNSLEWLEIWQNIRGFIQGRNPLRVMGARNIVLRLGVWKVIRGVTRTGEKPSQFDLCDKQFTRAGSLKKYQRCHTGEKSFQCDVCQKQFMEDGNLKRDHMIHRGEKPFQCDVVKNRWVYMRAWVSQDNSHRWKTRHYTVCEKWFSQTKTREYTLVRHLFMNVTYVRKDFTTSAGFKMHKIFAVERSLIDVI